MKQTMISLVLIGLSGYLGAQQQNALKSPIQPHTALFNPSTSKLPKHSVWELDPAHSTANLFVGSAANPEAFDVGVSRVSGTALIDRTKPADSSFNLTFYPAGIGGPTGPDGKLANGRNPSAFADTQLIFKSTRTVAASYDTLMVSGDLTLVRIERSAKVVLNEAYAGPAYGNPVVHTATHHLTLLLVIDSDAMRRNTPMAIAGTFRVARTDFPGLSSAVLHATWPTVVEDEHCQAISGSGEGYFGPSCSGETVAVVPPTVIPKGEGEDFHGFGEVPPTGNRLSINFKLAAVTGSAAPGQRSQ